MSMSSARLSHGVVHILKKYKGVLDYEILQKVKLNVASPSVVRNNFTFFFQCISRL